MYPLLLLIGRPCRLGLGRRIRLQPCAGLVQLRLQRLPAGDLSGQPLVVVLSRRLGRFRSRKQLGDVRLQLGTQRPRPAILRFPSYEQAKAWYESDAYAAPLALRLEASSGEVFLIEGIE